MTSESEILPTESHQNGCPVYFYVGNGLAVYFFDFWRGMRNIWSIIIIIRASQGVFFFFFF